MKKRFADTGPARRANSTNRTIGWKIGLAFVLGTGLVGCVGYVDGPRGGGGYIETAPPVYVESGVVVQPEYMYYPGYEVYYSSRSHHYVYREGRSWVSRPAPRGVSAEVLFASPSVRLNFHDHPSNHHAAISREYPKHWTPPDQGRGRNQDHRERE